MAFEEDMVVQGEEMDGWSLEEKSLLTAALDRADLYTSGLIHPERSTIYQKVLYQSRDTPSRYVAFHSFLYPVRENRRTHSDMMDVTPHGYSTATALHGEIK